MPTDAPTGMPAAAARTSIGVARMLADGTIVLMLRAEGADGALGDGQVTYQPTNPEYTTVRDHLGPNLKPGGVEVPVAPFPD